MVYGYLSSHDHLLIFSGYSLWKRVIGLSLYLHEMYYDPPSHILRRVRDINVYYTITTFKNEKRELNYNITLQLFGSRFVTKKQEATFKI